MQKIIYVSHKISIYNLYYFYQIKIMDDFKVLKQMGEDGAQGVVSLVEFPNGLKSAMKQFKKSKSTARIKQEADFQRIAADAGIAPEVMHVDLVKRRIFMEPMESRVVDVLEGSSDKLKEDLEFIMNKLDELDILHNDGNALNLMVDSNGCLRIIDFGLSKKITKAVRKKWDGHPNIKVTLFMIKKGLRKYNIHI
jgi:predicted Ser/Thr protein kinase